MEETSELLFWLEQIELREGSNKKQWVKEDNRFTSRCTALLCLITGRENISRYPSSGNSSGYTKLSL